jgi:hypothetical protein
MGAMTARKLSISMPPAVEETVKRAAAQEGKSISAWVTGAVTQCAAQAAARVEGRAAALDLVASYEAEHGPIPEASKRRVREFLAELGFDEPDQLQATG